MTEAGVTTPVTDRPLTAEDVALLRRGDEIERIADKEPLTVFTVMANRVHYVGRAGSSVIGGSGPINAFTFVARPPSVSADPVGGVTSGAGEVAPFAEGGIGHAMQERGYAYLKEYVLSTDGADYEPNEFERALLEDFMNGLLGDEAMFGPVRELLAAKAALTPREEAPAEPCKSCNGTGRELGSRFNRCEDCSEEAPAEGAGDDLRSCAHDAAVALESVLSAPEDETRRPHARHYLDRLNAALRARTSEPPVVALNRDQIAKIVDPEAFVPMEDVIGMRKAYVKADAILAGAAS